MSYLQARGRLAVMLALVALGCEGKSPAPATPPHEGPDVLAVLAWSPGDQTEGAVYCRYVGGVLDPKAPGLVSDPLTGGSVLVCPEDESAFLPAGVDVGWNIRVMFDELLDADAVEVLTCDNDDGPGPVVCEGTLATTHPLLITCGDDGQPIPYAGYYVPNGNKESFPVGPSIVAVPDASMPSFPDGTLCSVTVSEKVVDQSGIGVPRTDATFPFTIVETGGGGGGQGGSGGGGGAGGGGDVGGGGGMPGLKCSLDANCPSADPVTCACAGCAAQCGNSDCVCDSCAMDGYCTDPVNCTNDGACDPYNEGCQCADCALHPECTN